MIIENGCETYMARYDEFKKDYVENTLTVEEMLNKYQWGRNDYRKAVHHAWSEGVPRRKPGRRKT